MNSLSILDRNLFFQKYITQLFFTHQITSLQRSKFKERHFTKKLHETYFWLLLKTYSPITNKA